MAIRISSILKDDKRMINEKQLEIAEAIKSFLTSSGYEANITVSRYYSDRWYSLEGYAKEVEKGKGELKSLNRITR